MERAAEKGNFPWKSGTNQRAQIDSSSLVGDEDAARKK
jgi:hypothetical protein